MGTWRLERPGVGGLLLSTVLLLWATLLTDVAVLTSGMGGGSSTSTSSSSVVADVATSVSDVMVFGPCPVSRQSEFRWLVPGLGTPGVGGVGVGVVVGGVVSTAAVE